MSSRTNATRVKLTDEQRRVRRLASHTKYNTSLKGKKRYERYEAKHPERAGTRWEPARNGLNGKLFKEETIRHAQ